MHLRKTITILAFLLLSGCSKHDTTYYEAHIDEAKAKRTECEAAMGKAFMSKDKEKLEEISKDLECSSAVDVVMKHKKRLAKIQRDLKQKELEKLKKEKQKKFNEEYSKKHQSLKKLNYVDFFAFQKNCQGNFMFKDTPQCKAYRDLKKEKEADEIGNLKAKYVGGELEKFRDKSCKGLNFSEAYCLISTQAASQQQKEKINYYLSHRDTLKADFNKCHDDFVTLNKAKKWSEANRSTRTYKCSMVGKAASRLNIYSFNKAIK